MEHLLLRKHSRLHSCLKKQFQVFSIKQLPRVWEKYSDDFLWNSFSVSTGGMGGVRGIFITLVNMVCLEVLLTRGRSSNTQVNSHGGQQRQQHSGATSCFYRPANNVLVMSSCLEMTGIPTHHNAPEHSPHTWATAVQLQRSFSHQIFFKYSKSRTAWWHSSFQAYSPEPAVGTESWALCLFVDKHPRSECVQPNNMLNL